MDVKDLHATIDAKTDFECVNQLEPLTAPLQFFINHRLYHRRVSWQSRLCSRGALNPSGFYSSPIFVLLT